MMYAYHSSAFILGCASLGVLSLKAMWKTSNGDRNHPRHLRPHVLIMLSLAMLPISEPSCSPRISRQHNTLFERLPSSANACW